MEGGNLDVVVRFAEGASSRLVSMVDEVIALRPDVLLGFEDVAEVMRAKTTPERHSALTAGREARGSEADALSLAGDGASTGGAEDAEGYYREALAVASELGMRPLVAHYQLGLGKLSRRTGAHEQATSTSPLRRR